MSMKMLKNGLSVFYVQPNPSEREMFEFFGMYWLKEVKKEKWLPTQNAGSLQRIRWKCSKTGNEIESW